MMLKSQAKLDMSIIYLLFFELEVIMISISFFGLMVFKNYVSSLIYLYGLILFLSVIVYRKSIYKEIMCLIALGIYFLLTLLVNNGGIGSVFSNIFPLLLLFCFEYSEFSKTFKTIVSYTSLFMIIYLGIISTFVVVDYKAWLLGEINPNTVGMLILCFIGLWCAFTNFDSILNKVLFALLIVVCLMTITNVKARSSLIGCFLYLILFFVPKKIYRPKMFAIIIITAVVVGVILPLGYLYLQQKEVQFELFGKQFFSGREEVWRKIFDFTNEKGILGWLFGIGSHMAIHGENFDAHNSYYSLIACFGLLGFVFCISLYVSKLKRVIKHSYDVQIVRLMIIFIVMCVLSGFETIFGVSVLCFPIFLPLGMAMCRARELNSKKNMCADISIVSL